ncbi:hypothetical protein V6N12_068402 [Hibiscus sabdariffa]|uniref:DUF4283 domain-containing protein n=1 Tax=Hibiscus sabdariffa TaxID=183260 RepID=A0ABR2FPW8_9ROSI
MQSWSRSFSTPEPHPSNVIVWICLSSLLYQYYSKALFRLIATVIGRVIKVDCNTLEGEHAKFTRFVVLVDMNKPLVACIDIDEFVQKLGYEGLRQICCKCGVYSLMKEFYTVGTKMIVQNESGVVQGQNIEGTNHNQMVVDDLYGPWMMAVTPLDPPMHYV